MKPWIIQFARFGLVGLVNTTVSLLAIYSIIFFFNSGPIFANLIGYSIGLVISFYLNKFWTFADDTSKTKVIPKYLVVAALSYLSNLAMVFIGVYLFNIGPYLVQILGISISTIVKFIGCKFYVFNQNKNIKN